MTIVRTRLLVATSAVSLAAGVLAASPASGLPAQCSQSGPAVTCTFTSGSNAVAIPVGTSSVHVIAIGGSGSSNDVSLQTSRGYTAQPVPGGHGARVEGDIAVTGGTTTLYAVVGGNAQPGSGGAGTNGGGSGRSFYDGNGGGASDVRTAPNDLGSRLVVAAGGGGAGQTGDDGINSNGPLGTIHDGGRGGDAGANGGAGANDTLGDHGGGGGLAPVGLAGGKGGTGGSGGGGRPGCNGSDGSLGQGGNGADTSGACQGGGGGAGGGLYGGGGGGASEFRNPPQNQFTVASGGNGGGAGGSSLVPANGSLSIDTTGTPEIVLSFRVKGAPTISTQASANNLLGAPVSDVATLSGGFSPTGTVTFTLFSDSACGTQVFTSTNNLSGTTATSDSFTPKAPGTYYWTAVYNGDSDNLTSTSPCRAPNESVVISPFTPPTPTRTITGDTNGPIVVNNGESVQIAGARVAGPVTVNPGGSLDVVNSAVTGGITANAPQYFSLCGAQLSASPSPSGQALTVSNAPVPIRVGDPASGCGTNRLAGNVTLTSNLAVTFGSNVVSGNATINNNGPGATVVKANSVFQTLACSGNNPPPTNSSQPNSAHAESGQCSGL